MVDEVEIRKAIAAKRVNYRKEAFAKYAHVCAHCGFGIPEVLEVAHLNGDRSNNDISNLVILCPNCHKMHDLDLITTDIIISMRDKKEVANWGKRMRDAGAKAAATRNENAAKAKRKAVANKAVQARKKNAAKRALEATPSPSD